MPKIAYFNPEDNNRILQWMDTDAHAFNLPEASLLHQCTDVEWALQDHGDMMVKGGAVVPYVAQSQDVSQTKAEKWVAIKTERDHRIQSGGYKVGEKWYHSDTFSRTQQMGLVMLGANIPPNTPWKTMDGSFEVMTPALATQIFATAAASDIAIFAAAEAHKTAMEASQDPSTYDFSSGWPAIYEA